MAGYNIEEQIAREYEDSLATSQRTAADLWAIATRKSLRNRGGGNQPMSAMLETQNQEKVSLSLD